ncbi:MAG: DUF192 domain-containing protein [Candidatus Paceibacterota bacterium]|jgi:hypothetical protein
MVSKKINIFFVVLLIFLGFFLFFRQTGEIKEVIVGEKTFFVEVSRTKTELERGLSLHVPLSDNQGMLFVFQKEDLYGFWMKDMSFSLDIIWIDSNLKIVYIEKSILPETYPKVFLPKTKSLYVLEIPAGQTNLLKINVGDKVKFVKK